MKQKKTKAVEALNNLELYQRVFQIVKVGNKAVHEAQKKNRKLGIPSVYGRNGKVYFELPDGTITTKSPWHKKNRSK